MFLTYNNIDIMEDFMKKININQDELELMNYNDIAYVILKENGKKMKIVDLFNEVGKVLGLEEGYDSYITDFFELLSTDKRFIMLNEGYWDLRIKHDKGMVIEDEDEDEEIIIDDDNEDDDEYSDDQQVDIDDDVEEDDLSDLVIIDDSEEENL